jgi:hypothetical protein
VVGVRGGRVVGDMMTSSRAIEGDPTCDGQTVGLSNPA